MSRQKFSKEFKAQVALEAIRGIKTVNEIAAEFGVHPTQVAAWKREALEALPQVFGSKAAKAEADQKVKEDRLHAKIGQLQVEVDWLKKKTGHLD